MNELLKEPGIIVLFVVIILAGIISRAGRRSSRRNYSYPKKQPKKFQRYEDQLNDFPYQLQHHFLTPAELDFLHSLRRVVGSSATICPKVRLGDLFWVKLDDPSKSVAYDNKINRKHVDFLLCDLATMQPLVGIELDDKSHQREDRQARDAFVDQVFAAAKLPLVHIPTQRAYVVEQIAAQIAPYVDVVPAASLAVTAPVKPIQAPVPPSPVPSASLAPRCPKCGSKMILRRAKSGANAGNKFWGCSTYPTCRGMVAFTG